MPPFLEQEANEKEEAVSLKIPETSLRNTHSRFEGAAVQDSRLPNTDVPEGNAHRDTNSIKVSEGAMAFSPGAVAREHT